MARDQTKPAGFYCHGTSKQKGTPCEKRAGFGTDHVGFGLCKFHGGATKTGTTAAKHQEAEQLVATYGLPRQVDPHTALLEELHRTAGHVAWLSALIGELDHAAGGQSGLKQYQHLEDGGTIERPAIWVELYARERKHLAAVARSCIDVGIEERRIRIAEDQAGELAGRFRRFALELGLDLGAENVRQAFRAALTAGDVIEGSVAA